MMEENLSKNFRKTEAAKVYVPIKIAQKIVPQKVDPKILKPFTKEGEKR